MDAEQARERADDAAIDAWSAPADGPEFVPAKDTAAGQLALTLAEELEHGNFDGLIGISEINGVILITVTLDYLRSNFPADVIVSSDRPADGVVIHKVAISEKAKVAAVERVEFVRKAVAA